MTTLRDVAVSAIVNGVTTVAFLLGFIILHLQPVNDRVYHPKLYIKGIRRGSPPSSRTHRRRSIDRYFQTNCREYIRVFDWVKAALRMPEQSLIDQAGLDAAVYLRIYLVGLKIFVPLLVIGVSVLVTVNLGAGFLQDNAAVSTVLSSNVTSTNTSSTQLLFSSIDKLSISNIQRGSNRLWAHLVIAYVFTGWTCYVLFQEYRTVTAMRQCFLVDEHRRPDQFTVLVRQVPLKSHEPISALVEKYFHTNHPDTYLTYQLVYNANKLTRIARERDKTKNWLAFFELKYERDPSNRPSTRPCCCGVCGRQVDAINYYTAQIERLTEKVEAERLVVLRDPSATMATAFVSFKSRWGAAVCAQTQQTQDPTHWLTEWAPEPRDVYWTNLAIPYMELGCRRLAMAITVFVLVFFFLIPVALIQSLASLEGLQESFPGLSYILQRPLFASFVQGFLPGFILKLFMMILPTIIMGVSKMEGHLSFSRLDRTSAAKLYYFMVVNVFFGSILTGSAFSELKAFVSSSSVLSIIKTLAYTIPMKASFFITYIMIDGWSGTAGEILRFFPLLSYSVKNAFFIKTEGDRMKAMSPGTISFYTALPQLELYFLMGLVYSVISPVILPFIVVFFLFGFVVYRHQIINVYDAQYESGGAFWPHVHGRIIAAMIIEQLTLIGLFLIQGPLTILQIVSDETSLRGKLLHYVKQALSSTPIMVALPILTLVFHVYCKHRFETGVQEIPLGGCHE